MKKLPKLALYNLARFSSTPTFGWYFSILSIWIKRERRLYNESRLVSLFSFCYSKREGGLTKNGRLWRGSTFSLMLFFIPVFKIKRIKSIEDYEEL